MSQFLLGLLMGMVLEECCRWAGKEFKIRGDAWIRNKKELEVVEK